MNKLSSTRGVARIVVIFAIVAIVLGIIFAVPFVRDFNNKRNSVGCANALDTARRQLSYEYLSSSGNLNAKQAYELVGYAMDGYKDICPKYGTVYLIKSDKYGMEYDLVCGIHGDDLRQVTRLNAGFVLDQVSKAVLVETKIDRPAPETVNVIFNNETHKASLVESDSMKDINHGTDYLKDYKGIVIYYGVSDKEVDYFVYADKNYCAIWKANDGWTGDAYKIEG